VRRELERERRLDVVQCSSTLLITIISSLLREFDIKSAPKVLPSRSCCTEVMLQ
jgi:hypothetical protein